MSNSANPTGPGGGSEALVRSQLMISRSLRGQMLRVAARTPFSLSQLARISLSRLMRDLGDPEDPDMNVLMRYYRESGEAGGLAALAEPHSERVARD